MIKTVVGGMNGTQKREWFLEVYLGTWKLMSDSKTEASNEKLKVD